MRHQLNLTLGEGRAAQRPLQPDGPGQPRPVDPTCWKGKLSQFSGHGQVPQHHVQQLYAEHEGEGRFYRLGYFSPYAQGLVRQPAQFGGGTPTVLGVMLGDSDTLLVEQGQGQHHVPLYVTPSRPGMVEIYQGWACLSTPSRWAPRLAGPGYPGAAHRHLRGGAAGAGRWPGDRAAAER